MKCVFRTTTLNGFTCFPSSYISISGQIVQTLFPVRWPLKLQTTHHAVSDSSTTYIHVCIYICVCIQICVKFRSISKKTEFSHSFWMDPAVVALAWTVGVGRVSLHAPSLGQGDRVAGAQFLPICSKMSSLESPMLGPGGTWVLWN